MEELLIYTVLADNAESFRQIWDRECIVDLARHSVHVGGSCWLSPKQFVVVVDSHFDVVFAPAADSTLAALPAGTTVRRERLKGNPCDELSKRSEQELAVPQSGLIDEYQHPWDRVDASPDGHSVRVRYMHALNENLASVESEEFVDKIKITLHVGRRAPNVDSYRDDIVIAMPPLLVREVTEVALLTPLNGRLIVDGALKTEMTRSQSLLSFLRRVWNRRNL